MTKIQLTCQHCAKKQKFNNGIEGEEVGWTAIKIGEDLPEEIPPKQREWYCPKESCQDVLVIDTITELLDQGEDLDSKLIKKLKKKKEELKQ